VCDFFSTGLVKILKKYNKRTGAGLLLPGIATLQEKAFFKTETVSQMVRGCEAMQEAAVPAAALEGARRDHEALALAEQSRAPSATPWRRCSSCRTCAPPVHLGP
jgi:hypothetical protein